MATATKAVKPQGFKFERDKDSEDGWVFVRFEIRGTVLVAADALGVRSVHVSLSHDGGLAAAFVVLEG